MTPEQLQQEADKFKWYHEIELGLGVKTKPEVRYQESWDLIDEGLAPLTFEDKSVLDIGTRDGKYAFIAEQKWATVTAIDNNPSPAGKWAKYVLNSQVEFKELNLYKLPVREKYDVVLLFGVLYHLRYPMTGLRMISKVLVPHGKLYIESGMLDAHHNMPLLYCPVRTSEYEQTSCSFFNIYGLKETLLSFGLFVNGFTIHPNENGKRVRRYWIEAEKTHEMPDDLHKYWEGTHTSHD